MRADVVDAGALHDVLVHHATDRARGDARALIVEEDGLVVALRDGRVVEERGARLGQIPHQRVQRRLAERDDALLAPLALDPHHPLTEVNVVQVELRQLRDAYACAVEHLQDGAVALSEVCLRVRRLDEADGVLDREVVRQLLLQARRGDQFRRVQLDDALAHEELEEGAQRRELPGNRGLLLLRRVQLREPLADGDVVYLAYLNLAARARLRVGGREVFEELGEVNRVVSERVLAHVALVAQVFEELCE